MAAKVFPGIRDDGWLRGDSKRAWQTAVAAFGLLAAVFYVLALLCVWRRREAAV